jgi:hypothetical protein
MFTSDLLNSVYGNLVFLIVLIVLIVLIFKSIVQFIHILFEYYTNMK